MDLELGHLRFAAATDGFWKKRRGRNHEDVGSVDVSRGIRFDGTKLHIHIPEVTHVRRDIWGTPVPWWWVPATVAVWAASMGIAVATGMDWIAAAIGLAIPVGFVSWGLWAAVRRAHTWFRFEGPATGGPGHIWLRVAYSPFPLDETMLDVVRAVGGFVIEDEEDEAGP